MEVLQAVASVTEKLRAFALVTNIVVLLRYLQINEITPIFE
jgi:hypothetical protein